MLRVQSSWQSSTTTSGLEGLDNDHCENSELTGSTSPADHRNMNLTGLIGSSERGHRLEHGTAWSQLPLYERLSDKHKVGGLPSQMNLKGWLHELSFEHDQHLRDYLIQGITDGFKILDENVEISEYECHNYKSASQGEAHAFITELIQKEIAEGKYIKSHSKPHNVHAIGAVPKKDKTYRPITDCKRPVSISVNNYMNNTHQQFTFSTVDDVTEMITQGCYMSSIDISAAYRSISIHPNDWDHQGIAWYGEDGMQYYKDTRLCFGVKCAPYIFTKISQFIVRCMNRRGFMNVIGYIDDFWIAEPTYQRCAQGQLALISLLGDLGFRVSWAKCVSPSTSIRYLGIVFNSNDMTLSLPEDKMQKLNTEIQFFKQKDRATKHQLQRLCGILAHASKVVYGGRTFSRRVIELLRKLPDRNVRLKLSSEFKKDLAWWENYAKYFNGHATMVKHHYSQETKIYTDASKSGYGVVTHNGDWMAGYFDCSLIPRGLEDLNSNHCHWENFELNDEFNINVAELIPVWLAVQRHSQTWRNRLVRCVTDNTQVMGAINKGRSLNNHNMTLLRKIFWASVENNFHLVSSHIEGINNFLPDALSRLHVYNDVSKLNGLGLCCIDT